MRLLILSSNNGGGHNSAGRAILDAAARRGIPCEMIDALALLSRAGSRAVEEIHVKSARYAPQLFQWGNRMAEQMTRGDKPSPCYRVNAQGAPKLARYIRKNGFDTVIATHVFPALTLTSIKRTLDPGLRSYFVATDYACAPFVCETQLDGYFIPHDRLRWSFLQNGVRPDRLFATGIPVSERLLTHADAIDARRRLELPPAGPIVMVMTGSMGSGAAIEQVSALLNTLQSDAHILLLCGNNERLLAAVNARYGVEVQVIARGYTDAVPLYLDACDALLSKPGGLSVTEAAVHGVPLVLTAPLPGWEAENVRFFTDLGLALPGETPALAASAAARLVENARLCASMRLRQSRQINAFAAADILAQIASPKPAHAPLPMPQAGGAIRLARQMS